MRNLLGRLSYANVMSTLAVFLVLGGASAFAATQIAKNSVGSAQLKRNAVTTGKIRANAVDGRKVRNGSLSSADVDLATLVGVPTANRLTSYVRVADDGTVLPGSSLSQANLTKKGTGFYCFAGIVPAPVGLVATVDYQSSGKETLIQAGVGPGPVCPQGTQLFVNTRKEEGVLVDAGFFALIY